MPGATERRGVDDALRPACRLALDVARFGEQLALAASTPGALVPILRFRRLNAAAYETIARVVEEDKDFRSQVAAVADETDIGRAGWLWLERPEGWQEELDGPVSPDVDGCAPSDGQGGHGNGDGGAGHGAVSQAEADQNGSPTVQNLGSPPSARRGRSTGRPPSDGEPKVSAKRLAKAEAALERHRRQAAEADERRRKATTRLTELRRERDDAKSVARALQERVYVLEAERNDAMRKFKAMEADLNETRASLRTARAATTEAEAELRSLRTGQDQLPNVADPAPDPDSVSTERPTPPARETRLDAGEEPWDRVAVADAIIEAAHAAQAIARSLETAASALTGPRATSEVAPGRGLSSRQVDDGSGGDRYRTAGPRRGRGGGASRGGARPKGRPSGRSRRAQPSLPPGVFDGSMEAERHLLLAGEAVVLVDGYNVARTAWPELAPEEERHRLVRLLEEIQARSRGRITVVFDGETGTVAPQASRSVHVVFSATGVTADDDIAARLAEIPADQSVVVVSSDGEVMADARRQGAVPMTTPAFLAAARR